jgi:hypothetical protein
MILTVQHLIALMARYTDAETCRLTLLDAQYCVECLVIRKTQVCAGRQAQQLQSKQWP